LIVFIQFNFGNIGFYIIVLWVPDQFLFFTNTKNELSCVYLYRIESVFYSVFIQAIGRQS